MSAMLLYIITNAVLFSFLMTHETFRERMADAMIGTGVGIDRLSADRQRSARRRPPSTSWNRRRSWFSSRAGILFPLVGSIAVPASRRWASTRWPFGASCRHGREHAQVG